MASSVIPPVAFPSPVNGSAPADVSVPDSREIHQAARNARASHAQGGPLWARLTQTLNRLTQARPGAESGAVAVWPKTSVRIGFGLIWLIDAVFKWLPDFHKGLLAMVKTSAAGQPAWLHWWFNSWVSIVKADTNFWAYLIAALETVIALALIFGFARKLTYVFTFFAALFIWGVGEGFGGPYSGSSTDIGASVIYAVVACALLVLSQYPSSRFSVDYLLEQRISWWHKVAEFGKHNHPASDAPEAAALAPSVMPGAITH